jgi:hypothetical protein
MYLKTAFIFCKEPKTDVELKAIMATHPWAPTMTYGFYKLRSSTWADERNTWSCASSADSIYVDTGYGFGSEKWIAESFDEPFLMFTEREDWGERCRLQRAWWKAVTELLLNNLPESYHSHTIRYGELEDEFEPGAAEKAWKEMLLADYNYDPKIVAEFEPTAA